VSDDPGIYVEIRIQAPLEEVWRRTQEPQLHQRWDLRFSRIEYLPRPDLAEPQRFLYETRIGFGLHIRGTGESIAQRSSAGGDTISSLRFASADPKSLIESGSGYWRYVPTDTGLRFLTWYDYKVRFGAVGRAIDRTVFRPLMGWATAWSFDCLRLWAEERQIPESSIALSLIHTVTRVALAVIWIWHGLVPKLLYRQADERIMLAQAHLPRALLPWIGIAEILFGVTMLLAWHRRVLFPINVAVMLLATAAVMVNSRMYVTAAFNPVTLNLSVIVLAVIGSLASRCLPSARRCLRVAPESR
jgi:uncharacterized membrane protein YphA (DoxX/SURF4 family)